MMLRRVLQVCIHRWQKYKDLIFYRTRAKTESGVEIFQNPIEFEFLLGLVKRRRPRNILEIGSLYGGTLYHWLKLESAVEVCSVDMIVKDSRRKRQRYCHDVWKKWAGDKKLTVIEEDSTDPRTLEMVRAVMPRVDFLFIDGAHDYFSVCRDYELYSQLVSKGGMIAFHDIDYNENSIYYGVKPLWHKLKKKNNTSECVIMPGEYGIGVLYK